MLTLWPTRVDERHDEMQARLRGQRKAAQPLDRVDMALPDHPDTRGEVDDHQPHQQDQHCFHASVSRLYR